MAVYKGNTVIRNDLKTIAEATPMGKINFIGDKILIPTPVNEKTAQVPELSTGVGMKSIDTKRAPKGTFKRGEYTYGANTYYTYQYGYEEPVDNVQALEESEIFNDEQIATMVAVSQLKIAREKRCIDALTSTTLFSGGDYTTTAAAVWSNVAGATVFVDIDHAYNHIFTRVGIPKTGCRLLLNEVALRYAIRTTDVAGNLKYTTPLEKMSENEQAAYLATFLGIQGVDVATSFVDSKPLGIEDAEFSRIMANTKALLYVPTPSVASFKFPGIGRQPVYSKYSKDYVVETYPEEQSDAIIVRAREYRGEYLDVAYGYLITTVL